MYACFIASQGNVSKQIVRLVGKNSEVWPYFGGIWLGTDKIRSDQGGGAVRLLISNSFPRAFSEYTFGEKVGQSETVKGTARVQTTGSESGIESGTYSRLDDRELISKLLEYDSEAWNELVVRYQRMVYAQVLKALPVKNGRNNETIVEDILSEVFVGLLQNDMAALKGFKGQCKLSTWLCVVARRVTWRHYSKRPRERQMTRISDSSVQVELGITEEVDILANLIGTENKLLLAECLDQLKPADRQILEMYYHQELDYREISQRTGLSVNAVGPKLSRAHDRLRKLMGRG